MPGLVGVQAEQLGRGGSRSQGPVPRLVVQAPLHEVEVGVEGHLALDLQAQNVSGKHILA